VIKQDNETIIFRGRARRNPKLRQFFHFPRCPSLSLHCRSLNLTGEKKATISLFRPHRAPTAAVRPRRIGATICRTWAPPVVRRRDGERQEPAALAFGLPLTQLSHGQRRTRRASRDGGACPPAVSPGDRPRPYAVARVGRG
jgi:hypothetical protein